MSDDRRGLWTGGRPALPSGSSWRTRCEPDPPSDPWGFVSRPRVEDQLGSLTKSPWRCPTRWTMLRNRPQREHFPGRRSAKDDEFELARPRLFGQSECSSVMKSRFHEPNDLDRLRELVTNEATSPPARSFSHGALVAREYLEGDEPRHGSSRPPRLVDEWAGRYRGGWLPGLLPREPRDATAELSPEQVERLKARTDAGRLPADGRETSPSRFCTLRGKARRADRGRPGRWHETAMPWPVLRRRLGWPFSESAASSARQMTSAPSADGGEAGEQRHGRRLGH